MLVKQIKVDILRIIMSNNYNFVFIQETKEFEARMPLMAQTSGSQFFIHPSSDKVCLFFHGFTATPEQFVVIGQAFFKAGYNVLIPLLPGHGMAGDWNKDNPPPLPENKQIYQKFGLQWLQVAKSLGKKVIVGGLSGGSTLAAWLALECPEEIDRTLVFAPYLSGSNKVVDLFVRLFNIYFEWRTEPGLAHFGYDGFVMPALRVFLDMGADVLEQAQKTVAAPMLILSSESDRAVGNREHKALFESTLGFQPKSWYISFDRVWDIPHNMMTVGEGNENLNLLIAVAKAYVKSDLTWAEVTEICDRLRLGNLFDTVIDQLHLRQSVAPELFTVTGIIDSSIEELKH